MQATAANVEARYRRGEKRLDRILNALRSAHTRVSLLRFLAFLVALGGPLFFIFGVPEIADARNVIASGLPGLVGFVVLFFYHDRLGRRIRLCEAHLSEYRDCLRRFQEDWDEHEGFPHHPREGFAELIENSLDHSYGSDLNLFGSFSLFRYINRASTPGGELTLARALLGQPGDTVRHEDRFRTRQKGLQALARLRVLRMRFRRQGREGVFDAVRDGSEDWLREIQGAVPPALAGNLVWPAAALAIFTLVSYFAFALELARPYFVLTVPVQLLLFLWTTWRSVKISRAWAGAADRLEVYAGLLRVCAGVRPADPYLAAFSVFPAGAADEQSPYAKIRSLARLAGIFSFRRNPIVHFVLGVFFVYELFLLRALERWCAENLDQLQRWLDDLGRFDAALSLAEFAADHPEFVWPQLAAVADESQFVCEAEELAHPLLGEDARVGNSFRFEADQALWLISGSNMSGKSTFLRSVGTALVLAMAGAPVCARRFVFRPVRLWTSITVRDDLRRSLSLFYSEVKRIRLILDEANERRPPLLYLIDEMLHGTNSRERNIACRAILRQLRERGATGMITTHDLGLLDLCENQSDVYCAHFEEVIVEDRMSFDYKIKQGPVTRSNALKILEMEGIRVD